MEKIIVLYFEPKGFTIEEMPIIDVTSELNVVVKLPEQKFLHFPRSKQNARFYLYFQRSSIDSNDWTLEERSYVTYYACSIDPTEKQKQSVIDQLTPLVLKMLAVESIQKMILEKGIDRIEYYITENQKEIKKLEEQLKTLLTKDIDMSSKSLAMLKKLNQMNGI